MSSNKVKVCIRTRPTQYFAQDAIVIDEEHNTIQVTNNGDVEPGGMLNNKNTSAKFRYDKVFHNASQVAVYDLYARDTVQGVVDGINGAILTYGQTGSGKTFTMMGDTSNYEHRGVAPRSVTQLFMEINSRIEFEYTVSCTYMEIYNERIFDLLTDLSNPDNAKDFTIAEEKDGRGTFVRGLTEVEVKDENEALNLLFRGELSRTTAQHKLNRKSNRSHSIFTIYIQQRQRSGVSERVVHSKLHLVDLAGSERLKKTMSSDADDQIMKESMSINQSLSYLEQCVIKLAAKSSHIPYRQSRLTNILKDALGSNCNTVMIACMWGEATHLEETTSTLRLAARMMRVQNETSTIETIDSAALIKKQARIIQALKQELLMHDALVERTGVGYEPYTPEQAQSLAQMLERYIEAPEAEEEEVLNIVSYRQMLETCKQFKKMILISRNDVIAAQEMAVRGGVDALGRPITEGGIGGDGTGLETRIADEFDPDTPFVGTGDSKTGFAIGAAASTSRPIGGVEGISHYDGKNKPMSPGAMSPINKFGGSGTMDNNNNSNSPGNRSRTGGKGSPGSHTDMFDLSGNMGMSGNNNGGQSALFEQYAQQDGSDLYKVFMNAKSELKDLRLKSKECSNNINNSKKLIDTLQDEIASRKVSRIEMLRKSGLKASETEDIVDEEEFQLMQQLKSAKKLYKTEFNQLKNFKNMTSDIQMKVERSREDLASGFMSATNQGGNNNDGDNQGNNADQLDDQEAFDRLETQRVLDNDPDSLAFFHAQKTRRALMTQNSATIKSIQKTKRLR
jgi:kinesin family member 6/9